MYVWLKYFINELPFFFSTFSNLIMQMFSSRKNEWNFWFIILNDKTINFVAYLMGKIGFPISTSFLVIYSFTFYVHITNIIYLSVRGRFQWTIFPSHMPVSWWILFLVCLWNLAIVNLVELLNLGNVKVNYFLINLIYVLFSILPQKWKVIFFNDSFIICYCSGHFGFIELPTPVYHPFHVSHLKNMLNLLCLKCLRVKKGNVSLFSNLWLSFLNI